MAVADEYDDDYDALMAQYGKMEEKSAAGDSKSFSLKDYAHQYEQMRSTYLEAAKALKMATGSERGSCGIGSRERWHGEERLDAPVCPATPHAAQAVLTPLSRLPAGNG